MPEKERISRLLSTTRSIIELQKQVDKLRGENFNIFSILKMERKENDLHSAFIGELLNPEGNHNLGAIFLIHFCTIIDNNSVKIDTAKVELEKYIGARDDEKKIGGRIDIYIHDRDDNIISIENKIDAQDQYTQIERYCNHKRERNKVFYLTLDKKEPTFESKGELKSGEDFHLISYKYHIIKWLQICLKEAVDVPILRESIKQYLILIKKLTGTMGEENENALDKLMIEYYEESSIISSNFIAAQERIFDKVRDQVVVKLENRLDEKYKVEKGDPVQKIKAQIMIKFTDNPDAPMCFEVESFTGKGVFGGRLFVGILNWSGKKVDSFGDDGDDGYILWWPKHKLIEDYKGFIVNLSEPALLIEIISKKGFLDGFTDYITDTIIDYIQQEAPELIAYLEKVR